MVEREILTYELFGTAVPELARQVVEEARTAVIYEKPWTVTRPEYVWRHTEAAPPLVQRAKPGR